MNSVSVNGKLFPADKPVLLVSNRGYRYGDGLFETMKLINGKIILEAFHFERLFQGLELLKFKVPPSFTAAKLRKQALILCDKNKCGDLARVRLSVCRGNGGLHDQPGELQWLIECQPADRSANAINKKGISIDIYPGLQKTCDVFSNLKSANFLPYAMAAEFARENKLDDCIVCNTRGQIADATIANIFLIKNKLVITPALTEGCVNGVMRRYILEKLRQTDLEVREGVVTRSDLETFDEVFLTNAMVGIKWVAQSKKKKYKNTQTLQIYKDHVSPLFS
jgi:branched-chain amino acid aminotransferase